MVNCVQRNWLDTIDHVLLLLMIMIESYSIVHLKSDNKSNKSVHMLHLKCTPGNVYCYLQGQETAQHGHWLS